MLGLSTVRALKTIRSGPGGGLRLINETLALPRADLAPPIAALQAEQTRLLASLTGTSLNLKTFLALTVKYRLSPDFPSSDSHRYLHERMLGREALKALDEHNRAAMRRYVENIHIMEELTRVRENMALLEKHRARNEAAGERTIAVEVAGLRIGEFVLVTFPGELSVQIGLGIKERSPHRFTFVAGYTNGYIYYTPTEEQLRNVGGAQEDSDCLVAPGWQALYEAKAAELLQRL
jgi:hypothetical protein